MRRCSWIFAVVLLFAVAAAWSVEAAGIKIVAVAPRDIAEGKVDTLVVRQSTSGLSVVGVGEQVCLMGGPSGIETPTLVWELTSAPTGATAVLSSDASGDLMQLTPDAAGDYVVTLTVNGKTEAGADTSTTVTKTITSAKYIGAATCGQCHPGQHAEWDGTGHATMLERGLKGIASDHYGPNCISCHTVGYNTSGKSVTPGNNDGFQDIARDLGWTFPEELNEATWENLPAELKNVAGIQCESCHGPGSAHQAGGMAGLPGEKKIGESLMTGVCARCHDSGTHRIFPNEWKLSGHANTWTRTTTSCAPCHLGEGFLTATVEGKEIESIGEMATITCAVCHDPHGAELRTTGAVTLNALVPGQEDAVDYVAEMGNGATCAQCHHLRPGRNVPGTSIHRSHQTEMLQGIGGYHYPGQEYPGSLAHKNAEGACVACHMAGAHDTADPGFMKIGGHSWRMSDDNGTPDDPSDDLHNTHGCESCHGPVHTFNINGAQTEIEEMMHVLADLLPSVEGEPGVPATYYREGGHGSAVRELTEAEMYAGWNYRFVEEDFSEGVHNFRYAQKLLGDALKAVRPASETVSGDFNNDNKVNFTDLFMFVAHFVKSAASEGWDMRYDLSGNGVVGFADWLMFLDAFGATSAAGKPLLVENGINTQAAFSLMGSNMQSIDRDHLGVTVRADRLTEMRGYGVVVTYDPEALSFVRAVRAGDGLVSSGGPAVMAVEETPGRVLISDAVVGNQAVSGSGLLADLVFKVLGPANDSSVLIDFVQVADLSYGINLPLNATDTPQAQVAYALSQNYPNPFNPATSIHYSLAEPGEVKVVVYNTLGQVVRTLVDHYKLSGDYSVRWDGKDSNGREVSSGIYVYKMQANGFSASHRMVLMK